MYNEKFINVLFFIHSSNLELKLQRTDENYFPTSFSIYSKFSKMNIFYWKIKVLRESKII